MPIGHGCDRQIKATRRPRPSLVGLLHALPISQPSNTHLYTHQERGDACHLLGPAPICALGPRGIFFVLFFEKTPQKLHAHLGGTAAAATSSRIIMWSGGQLPRSPKQYAVSQEKGCSLSRTGLLGRRLCEV